MLFTFVGGWGHAEPLVPIARAAVHAGHVVAFAGQAALVPLVEALEFAAFATGPSTVSSTRQPLVAPDRQREQRVLRDAFAGHIAHGRAADLFAACERWKPDVVVSDEMDFGAMIAAERFGVPSATVVVIASGAFVAPASIAGPLNELRAEHRLDPDPALTMLHRDLVLVPVPPSFLDPRARVPATARFVRPAVLSSPAEPADVLAHRSDRATVYVTLGTIFNLESGDVFTRVLTGLGDRPLDVIVTVGPHIDPSELGPQPGNVHIERFIPQASLLPYCDAVVCHGGSGTVVAALAHGVPLVLTPMGADQPHNADRCEALGVGVTLDVMSATPSDVRDAVSSVLTDPTYRRNAAALRAEAASLPAASDAVRALEQLVVRRPT